MTKQIFPLALGGLAIGTTEFIIMGLLPDVAKDLGVSSLVVTGGVACNSRLRAKLPEAYFPAPKHCSDNAAMIALVAALKLKKGGWAPAPWETTASARSRLFVTDRR